MLLKMMQRTVASEKWMRRLSPAFGPLNPFLPEHRADPYTTWNRLREESPVFYSRVFGAWFVTRYDDCLEALSATATSTDRSDLMLMKAVRFFNRNHPEFGDFLERSLLMLEGAEHRRLRGLVSKAFTPRRVGALRPRLEALADELLVAPGASEVERAAAVLLEPVTVALGDGFHGPEFDAGRRFSWALERAEVRLRNPMTAMRTVQLRFVAASFIVCSSMPPSTASKWSSAV